MLGILGLTRPRGAFSITPYERKHRWRGLKRAVQREKHHKAVLETRQGYYGTSLEPSAPRNEQVNHSMAYAFGIAGRRKGDFRRLWIQRINAAAA